MPLFAQNYLWDGNSVHEYSQARERLMNDTLLDANDVVKSGMYSGYIVEHLTLVQAFFSAHHVVLL